MEEGNERPVHGAFDYRELAELGLSPEEILDFSVNSNPYGPSPRAQAALADIAIDRYPDRECLQLRQAILRFELAEEQQSLTSLVCGNGTAELIWAVARAFLKHAEVAAVVGPTFGEYRAASLAAGASMLEWRAAEAEYFRPDIDALTTWIARQRPALLWLCNPNNPTGIWLDQQQLLRVARTCQEAGTLLVVDESYKSFLSPEERCSALYLWEDLLEPRPLVLRSLTKDFCLAGLRLGYAVGDVRLIELLRAQLPSWNVNGIAQTVGCVALTDREHLSLTLQKLAEQRQAFFAALLQSGFAVMPSRTHFCLIEVGDGRTMRQRLLQRKILVRDCSSFGLPRYIRVATRRESEWQRLVHTLEEIR